ncbi:MAG: flagellar hook protein FlgE [Actinomycetota bacterium]|nr:flagellar hook protein FlgE [Actinomycetota bacterium]
MTEQSILAAVSGIQANQTWLDSIANNIANVNTVGYKSSQVQFQDLLAQQLGAGVAPATGSGGVNPLAIGSGVRVAATQLNMSQGGTESTGVPTDVAIQGNGYLVVQSGGQQLYTRNGALSTDANGNLTTSTGGQVLGWAASANGTINASTPLSAIKIPTGATVGANPTTEITLGGNLPAWSGNGTPPSPVTTTYDVYDSLGNAVPVTVTFTPYQPTSGSGANTWTVTATMPSPTGGAPEYLLGTAPTGTSTTPTPGAVVVFSAGPTGSGTGATNPPAGEVQSVGTGSTPPGTAITAQPDGSIDVPLTIPSSSGYSFPGTTIKLVVPPPSSSNAVTQYSSAQSLQIQSGDGNAAGVLKSYNIAQNGTITGTFSNNQTQVLGQIALAGFANPAGLAEQGNGNFAVSGNSGQALVGAAGTGSLGTLLGGELEQSNVSLGTELTNLITAQEAYTANTKVLTTSSTALQALEQVP